MSNGRKKLESRSSQFEIVFYSKKAKKRMGKRRPIIDRVPPGIGSIYSWSIRVGRFEIRKRNSELI